MKFRYVILALGLFGAGMTFAAEEEQGLETRGVGDDCVFFKRVNDWEVLNESQIVVWAPRMGDAYLVELSPPLRELRFSVRMALIDSNNDGRLCGFGTDRVVVPNSGSLAPEATIVAMRRLDDDALGRLGEKYDVDLLREMSRRSKQESE